MGNMCARFADPLMNSDVFPKMVSQMVAVGESTGTLDATLEKISDIYDDEVGLLDEDDVIVINDEDYADGDDEPEFDDVIVCKDCGAKHIYGEIRSTMETGQLDSRYKTLSLTSVVHSCPSCWL